MFIYMKLKKALTHIIKYDFYFEHSITYKVIKIILIKHNCYNYYIYNITIIILSY